MAKKNFTISTVATAPDPAASGTSLVVASGDGSLFADDEVAVVFPDGEQPTSDNAEIVLITNISTDTLTITREQESTSARTIGVGDVILQQISAGDWNDLITLVGGKQDDLTFGIANDNAVEIDDADAADNDYAKFTADGLEGRSYTEVKQDLDLEIGTDVLAEQTIGIANDNLVEMDDADATSGDYAKFTANGLQGRSASEVRSDINVEDGADVTDATNVNAAGATMNTDTDVSGNSWVLDQDDMSGDDNTKVATQQSVKAYVDAQGYEWQGAWVTATAYAVNDTVENDGSGYICTSAHTSGSTTEPDVGASWSDKWDLFIEGGTNLVEQVYPVGSIYINATSSTNPATLLGFGTWSAFGAGRVLVGIDSGDGDFDTAEETGGSKTASLSASNIPSHRHEMANHRHSVSITSGTQSASHKHTVSGTFGEASNAGSTRYPVSNEHAAFTSASSFLGMSYQNASHTHSVSGNTGYYGSGNYTGYYGSGDSFDIMNPYITVYMWKRTA